MCSWSGRPARPRTQHDYHHDTKVKPEPATAVIELLMMDGRTPKTFWAVNKRQDNKLENCCIWLVIYLNCTTMHGLTNLKCRLCTVMWELNPEILFRKAIRFERAVEIFRQLFAGLSRWRSDFDPPQSMWGSWWTMWHWEKFFSAYFGCPLLI